MVKAAILSVPALSAVVVFAQTAAIAEEPACAAKLTHDGALIYAEISKADPPAGEVRADVTKIVENMVRDGQIERATARANAVSAYECMASKR